MASGGFLKVTAHIDAVKTSDQFVQARRDINLRLKEGLKAAGEEVALPKARLLAGNLKVAGVPTASSLVVKARARDAVLTTNMRGKLARAVGLQEMGGTVKTPILPRRKKAVVVNGQPVAKVTTPRHYEGRRFLMLSVETQREQIDSAILRHVMRSFDGLEHTP
jgi:hypothetical protein